MNIMSRSVCRSAVRICHKWSPEETITDQKAKQEDEVRERGDYYNVIPGKTPPAGGMEGLRIPREENKPDADIQGVRSLYNTKTQYLERKIEL